MLAKLLEFGAAEGQQREIAVTKEEFLIGRGTDCDLRLQESAVSRHHCLLRFRPGETTLQDLGSANGTFVNDQRVRSQVTLVHGDMVRVGDFAFTVQLGGQSGIEWGAQPGVDPMAATFRLKNAPGTARPKKDESHPPGEAGGRGQGSV